MELEKDNSTWPRMYHERVIDHRVNSVHCDSRQNMYEAIEDDNKGSERFAGVGGCKE